MVPNDSPHRGFPVPQKWPGQGLGFSPFSPGSPPPFPLVFEGPTSQPGAPGKPKPVCEGACIEVWVPNRVNRPACDIPHSWGSVSVSPPQNPQSVGLNGDAPAPTTPTGASAAGQNPFEEKGSGTPLPGKGILTRAKNSVPKTPIHRGLPL
ncbi:uncharacterized protein LOC119572551 [Penaeus monodon]|uniref:uncharacterized protein LOC119572551 n=1 Tax=Penaeus monodon TaxID=6687 RepID=UPI0018A71E06|nr:uncharacterized protein LOC119572551 [Penaeus monodon]